MASDGNVGWSLRGHPERLIAASGNYGPAQGLPDTKVGTFTQALHNEAVKRGWTVSSMKHDWNRLSAFAP